MAQLRVGINGGYTLNNLDYSTGSYYDKYYQTKGGYSLSANLQYDYLDWLAIRVEPGFITKNYDTYRLSFDRLISNDNRFIQLPIMAQFSLGGERLRGFVDLGGYVGYWCSGLVYGDYLSIFSFENNFNIDSYEFDSTRDNRFDAGLLLGLGVEYRICDNFYATAESRLLYGLTDMQKQYMSYQYHRYNTTFLFQLGVSYKLKIK